MPSDSPAAETDGVEWGMAGGGGKGSRRASEEQGRAGQRNQTHYHRHYYDGDQLHMRWETAPPLPSRPH